MSPAGSPEVTAISSKPKWEGGENSDKGVGLNNPEAERFDRGDAIMRVGDGRRAAGAHHHLATSRDLGRCGDLLEPLARAYTHFPVHRRYDGRSCNRRKQAQKEKADATKRDTTEETPTGRGATRRRPLSWGAYRARCQWLKRKHSNAEKKAATGGSAWRCDKTAHPRGIASTERKASGDPARCA